MIAEILSEMWKEVVGSPATMIAEVVQFVILVGIIWLVAFGYGKRRGFVANMLTERQAQVRSRLEEAQGAGARLAEATRAAQQREAAAPEEAERLLAEARRAAAESEAQVHADADAEAARIVERAHTALANERAQMQAELRDQLVDLVSQATRSIMNEKLTVAEQRTRIEDAIVAGVASAGESDAAGKRSGRAAPARAAAPSGKAD